MRYGMHTYGVQLTYSAVTALELEDGVVFALSTCRANGV